MENVFRYIDKNRDRLIKLTKELVSIETVNPPGKNYEEIVKFLELQCKRLGLKTRRSIVPASECKKHNAGDGSKRINLIASWDTGSKKRLHINGHYDVVPAIGKWDTDPFKPVVKNNRIYGRGTEDMKANIAATIMAIEALKKHSIKPGCNIELSFTPDEETGGKTGFGYLVKKNIIRPDYAISEGYHRDYISYGNKGLVWFKIEVLGKSSHGSQPQKGINSFEKMIKLANELIKLKNKVSKRKTKFHTKDSATRSSTMMMGGELWGGSKTNIVPDRSCFTIDRRFLPEENISDVKKEITQVIDRLRKKDKDLHVKVTVVGEEDSVVSDEKSKLFTEFKKSVRKVIKKQPKCALLAGATDIRFLIRKGIPCLGYSVDGAVTAHSDNEFVYIKSLLDTTKIFADIIAKLT